MKKTFLTFSILHLFTICVFSQTKNFIDQPYIEVTGFADTLVTPDEIFIKIIISEKDSKDKTPVEEQENKMIAAFKTLKINIEKDLTTSDILSNYKFYLLKQKDILKSKEYILKVSDAATASKVFVQLEELGISNTSIDKVDHTNKKGIENTCRMLAITDARTKGNLMTKAISQTLGNAIFISENTAHNEEDLSRALQGMASGVMVKRYGSFDKDEYSPPKVEFEKISIEVKVYVKFILR